MPDQPSTDEVISMWQDLIHLAAFQTIHGAEAGYRRFRYLRFGTPESEPVPPEALHIEWPIYPRSAP